jgi:hypothetical protein
MQISVYHGTTALFREQIETNGVRSCRAAGIVYVTAARETAIPFARAWTFAMYAAKKVHALKGIVVHASVPRELVSPVPHHPTQYLMIAGGIPVSCIERIEEVDVSEGFNDPKRRWKRIMDVVNLLEWPVDRIQGRDDLRSLLPALERELEHAERQAELRGTPITFEDRCSAIDSD